MHKLIFFLVWCIFITLTGCIAPRNISSSGKVTPKGNVVGGFNISGNISTQTASLISDIVSGTIDDLVDDDSIYTDQTFLQINEAAIAYALDPLNAGTDFYLRYGIIEHFDAGIRFAGNAKAIDVQYQFLGPVGSVEDQTSQRFYASIGMQFSWQIQELPSILSDIQDRLGYSFKRKDILIPLIFSRAFDNEEKFGSVAFGGIINFSMINYAALPVNIYTPNHLEVIGIERKENFLSAGVFINCKIGYKYAYLLPSLSVYYQNYGNYQLLDGNSVGLKGWTIIPSIGLRIRIGKDSIAQKE